MIGRSANRVITAGLILINRAGGRFPRDTDRAFTASTKDAEAATALVNFLRTAEAAVVIKAKGMEPATP